MALKSVLFQRASEKKEERIKFDKMHLLCVVARLSTRLYRMSTGKSQLRPRARLAPTLSRYNLIGFSYLAYFEHTLRLRRSLSVPFQAHRNNPNLSYLAAPL